MKLADATEISTLILCWRASLLASPTVFPASIEPWRWIAPLRASIASSSVVLPLWNGPTSAMHRGPEDRVPFCAMSASQWAATRSSSRPSDAHRFKPEGGLARGAVIAVRRVGTLDGRTLGCRLGRVLHETQHFDHTERSWVSRKHARPNLRPLRATAQRPGRRLRSPMPTARLRPVWPDTEIGCKAIVRLEPPTRTLAPSPAASVASPLAPT